MVMKTDIEHSWHWPMHVLFVIQYVSPDFLVIGQIRHRMRDSQPRISIGFGVTNPKTVFYISVIYCSVVLLFVLKFMVSSFCLSTSVNLIHVVHLVLLILYFKSNKDNYHIEFVLQIWSVRFFFNFKLLVTKTLIHFVELTVNNDSLFLFRCSLTNKEQLCIIG